MNFKRQHKDAAMIRLHNDCDGQLKLLLSCPTGVVKLFYGIQTFRLTDEKAVYNLHSPWIQYSKPKFLLLTGHFKDTILLRLWKAYKTN